MEACMKANDFELEDTGVIVKEGETYDTDTNEIINCDQNKFADVLEERFQLFKKKNEAYGSSFRVEDIVGIVTRLGDKMSRLKRVSGKGFVMQVKEEGLQNLFEDIGNYCDIGLLLLKEKVKDK